MSGSPVLLGIGKAIGVVSLGNLGGPDEGPNPRLMRNLPGWLLRIAGFRK
jgi:hypothetical protein